DIGRAVHRVPPEQIGAGEGGIAPSRRFPYPLADHQTGRLPPEENLPEIAEIPAICDSAVLGWRKPGEDRALHWAGYRRNDGLQGPCSAAASQLSKVRRRCAQMPWRQAGNAKDYQVSHAPNPAIGCWDQCCPILPQLGIFAAAPGAFVTSPGV